MLKTPRPLRCASSQPAPAASQPPTLRQCTPNTRRWQGESTPGVLGSGCSPLEMSTALGRATYGGRAAGEDGQGLRRSLHAQVRGLLALPCRLGRPFRPPRTRPTPHEPPRPQHCGGTPRREPADLRVGRRGSLVGERALLECVRPRATQEAATRRAGAWWARRSEPAGLALLSFFSARSSPAAQVTSAAVNPISRFSLPASLSVQVGVTAAVSQTR